MKKDTLTHVVSIRIPDTEWEIIRNIADQRQISISALLRDALGIKRQCSNKKTTTPLANPFPAGQWISTFHKQKIRNNNHNNRQAKKNRQAGGVTRQGEAE